MRANRILIWRFAAAPAVLRVLCEGSTTPPEWLVLVPQSMSAIDLDAVILGRAEPGCIARYQTESGDVVYAGTCDTGRLPQALVRRKSSGRLKCT